MSGRPLFICIFFFLVLSVTTAGAQEEAQLNGGRSMNPAYIKDSLARKDAWLEKFRNQTPAVSSRSVYGSGVAGYIEHHPYFKLPEVEGKPSLMLERKKPDTDWIFYLLSFLVLLLALLRLAFNKYLKNLFRVFFNTSMRQRQITDQLQQDPLPSLLFNIYFALSSGVFLYFLLKYYEADGGINKWLLIGLCIIGISILYLGKFLILRLIGWIFGWEKAAAAYTFVVFMINKMVGMFLLLMTILLAFSPEAFATIFVTIAYIGLCLLYFYRMIRAYVAIRNELRINQLYFLLYTCAFEIIPVLLIYRLLLQVF